MKELFTTPLSHFEDEEGNVFLLYTSDECLLHARNILPGLKSKYGGSGYDRDLVLLAESLKMSNLMSMDQQFPWDGVAKLSIGNVNDMIDVFSYLPI